jgi:hypothetical protein
MVAWSRVTRPTELGGLGVVDLATMGYALRMRWEWLARVDPSQAWSALSSKPELAARVLFDTSTSVEVGNGVRALFWKDKWMQGHAIESLYHILLAAVGRRVAKNRRVADALHNSSWIRDITGSISIPALQQYITLWSRLQHVLLSEANDKFVWRWTANRQYSTASAHRALFV